MPRKPKPTTTHEKVAICAVDPGTVSGVARGIFPAQSDSVWGGLAEGEWESYEVEGEPARQGWEIVEEFGDWVGGPTYAKLRDQGVHRHSFVIEDFVIRLGEGASSRRDLLDPVRVAQSIETLCWRRDGMRWLMTTYQQPSEAKNFATNPRLKEHGLWVVGSDHRRDAVRHMAKCYATFLKAA